MYNERLVTAKKRKRCVWCGEWTEAGEQRWNRAYVFDGEFQSDHMHPECKTAMAASLADFYDEGFEDGAYHRGMTAEESERIDEAEWKAEEEAAEAEEEARA